MIRSETIVRVRYAETDMMGIVYHGSYVPWLECARIQLLDDIGCPYREMESLGVRLPVVELKCRYREPARFDDRVRVVAEVRESPRARITIHYRLFREEDGALLCEASSMHAFMDFNQRPCRPPKVLREAFESHLRSWTKDEPSGDTGQGG